MRGYKNNTADTAISSVDKEWRRMANLALIIRERKRDPVWIEEKEKTFTGIYKRLLTDPIAEVVKEAGR